MLVYEHKVLVEVRKDHHKHGNIILPDASAELAKRCVAVCVLR